MGIVLLAARAKGLERFDAGSVGFALTITVYTLIDGCGAFGP